jgi:hypothetical protein
MLVGEVPSLVLVMPVEYYKDLPGYLKKKGPTPAKGTEAIATGS